MQNKFYKKLLVLIGGGHANIQVLKKLCMYEYRGLKTILISDSYRGVYSGMLPGFIKKEYSLNEISIDLQRLCFNAGATFIKDEVISLDKSNHKIILANNPSISFDYLSINTGSVSNIQNINISDHSSVYFIKPIIGLINKLNLIDQKIINSSEKKIVVVGGGVAAFEISFAMYERYNGNVAITLVSPVNLKEKNLNSKSVNKLKKIAKKNNFKMLYNKIISITSNTLELDNGEVLLSNVTLLSTGASLPIWLKKSGLKIIDNFIAVNMHLQSLDNRNIFVSGDAASIQDKPRPKSGVMAVRQGEILKENLFLQIQNKRLKNFNPQKNWLYLIGTNKKMALLNYHSLSFHGKWCWILKKLIDLNFINKFTFSYGASMKKKTKEIDFLPKIDEMYCQGCGSKVSKNTLVRFLSQEGINKELSDSSRLEFKNNQILQTIDYIKLFSSLNPFDFGIISYLHSQNDILASGGSVHSLSLSIGIPFSEKKVEKFYFEYFMRGIQKEMSKDLSLLAAGHSYQTEEPGITIVMNGYSKETYLKSMAVENDLIYLSKPLGTGYLLRSYFQNSLLLSINDFQDLINIMKISNRNSFDIAQKFDSKIMTDVSGFGLASHLGDICKSSQLSANISLNKEILINSKLELINQFQSTGYENNFVANSKIVEIDSSHPFLKILYDPQTNGPLIITIKKKDRSTFEDEFEKKIGIKPLFLGNFSNKKEKLIYVN